MASAAEGSNRPRWSVRGWFSSQGRFCNRWARALAQADASASLGHFRAALLRLEADPAGLSHFCAPCVHSMLEVPRLAALSDDDFSVIERLATSLDRAGPGDCGVQILWHAVAARDVRHEERQARALIAKAFRCARAGAETRAVAARELARRGGRSDEEIEIYLDHLARVPAPGLDAPVIQLLDRVCTVGLEVSAPLLRRAGEVARRLLQSNLRLSCTDTTLGLTALLQDGAVAAATGHFEAAVEADPSNSLARTGLVAARIRAGNHCGALKAAGEAHASTSADPAFASLLRAARALAWLDSPTLEGPAPETGQSLTEIGADRLLGPALVGAIGRLHLIEGDAPRALEVLKPLATEGTEPRWCYHAAWANLLAGKAGLIASCAQAAGRWPAVWTIRCLEAEFAAPGLAAPSAAAWRDSMAPRYESVFNARFAIARSEPCAAPTWTAAAGTPEENLEALRTAIGHAVFTRDEPAMSRALAAPTFRRLARADREYWVGLVRVSLGDLATGLAALETAARRLGHPRAALALATLAVQRNEFKRARQFLQLAGQHGGHKERLLESRMDLVEGRLQTAVKSLETLAREGVRRADYALGNVYLALACQAPEGVAATLYFKQAEGAFRCALRGPGSAPPDTLTLADGAAVLAGTAAPEQALASHWPAARPQRVSRPWLAWNAAALAVRHGDAAATSEGAALLVELLVSAIQVDEPAALALGAAAVRACQQADHDEAARALCKLAEVLAQSSGSDRVRALSRTTRTITRRRYGWRPVSDPGNASDAGLEALVAEDPGNLSLALHAARECVAAGHREQAAQILSELEPADPLLRRTFGHLTALCRAEVVGGDLPLLVPPGSNRNTITAYHLARAAVLFNSGLSEAGCASLLACLRIGGSDWTKVVRLARFLPMLCAGATKFGTIPGELVDAIRVAGCASSAADELAQLARCAAVIGQEPLAASLWERALAHASVAPDALRQEFCGWLAHSAVVARRAGRLSDAAGHLRTAADRLLATVVSGRRSGATASAP